MASTIYRGTDGALLRQGNAEDALEATRGGYHLVVLCAMEWQPPEHLFPCRVVHVPQDDASLSKKQVMDVCIAAVDVARQLKKGRRVLVTCAQGRNRSGLVSALALRLALNMDGRSARILVQQNRPRALTNPSFARFLDSLSPPKVSA